MADEDKPENKELSIVISDQVKGKIAEDPELGKALQEMMAAFHQAHHAVQTGQHETFEDAMEAITGKRPEPVDDPGD